MKKNFLQLKFQKAINGGFSQYEYGESEYYNIN